MIDTKPQRLLLGPQRPVPNLREAVDLAGFGQAGMAVISAGWQEAEADIDDVRALLKRPLADLDLYQRAEQLFGEDVRLRDAYRLRQDRLLELQRLYRLRLRQLSVAARATLRATGSSDLLGAERRHAVAQLRALDRHHLRGVEAIYADFEEHFNSRRHAGIAEHAAAIAGLINASQATLITGGNVVVMLNRMRLFNVGALLLDTPVIGWSAGAMVLANRIILYHDKTPQGRRDPEIFAAGIGALPGHILVPDAARRLRRKDRLRMQLFSRRFSTEVCLTLDNGSAVRFAGETLVEAVGARRIAGQGRLAKVRTA